MHTYTVRVQRVQLGTLRRHECGWLPGTAKAAVESDAGVANKRKRRRRGKTVRASALRLAALDVELKGRAAAGPNPTTALLQIPWPGAAVASAVSPFRRLYRECVRRNFESA
jgi:hypothetical protein